MKITTTPYVPVVRDMPASSAAKPAAAPPQDETVTLSAQSKALAAKDAEVSALHKRIYGDPSLGVRVQTKLQHAGYQKFSQTEPPQGYSGQEAERFQRALDYLNHRHGAKTDAQNPFASLGRDALVAIIQDERSYSEEERYAAELAKSDLDEAFFSRLIQYSDTTGDSRPLMKGYLEYLNNLTPVERLNYPSNEGDKVAGRLARLEEELGSLPEGFSLWQYMNWAPEGRLDLDALLNPAPSSAPPAATEGAGDAGGQGSSRLR
ncbi:hypothetical protein ACIPZC_18225 [Pseudomonas sp. NPDC089743]|uniref:hypothetical protein n=1 Tax=Pseudomonas sp. NPDC089743 TaxID=3364471 RepID=UPI003828988C